MKFGAIILLIITILFFPYYYNLKQKNNFNQDDYQSYNSVYDY